MHIILFIHILIQQTLKLLYILTFSITNCKWIKLKLNNETNRKDEENLPKALSIKGYLLN